MWFDTKRRKGANIHGKTAEIHSPDVQRKIPVIIPENPALDIQRKCDYLKDIKSQLRRALDSEHQIFRNVEMPEEWSNASLVVRTKDSWDIFIKAFRDIFVEDMVVRLDAWKEKNLYSELNKQLYSIRVRRNYVEHPDSVDGKKEEESRCLKVIGKRFPTSGNEWLALQLDVLNQIEKALTAALEQVATT